MRTRVWTKPLFTILAQQLQELSSRSKLAVGGEFSEAFVAFHVIVAGELSKRVNVCAPKTSSEQRLHRE